MFSCCWRSSCSSCCSRCSGVSLQSLEHIHRCAMRAETRQHLAWELTAACRRCPARPQLFPCRAEEVRAKFERYGAIRDVYLPKDYCEF